MSDTNKTYNTFEVEGESLKIAKWLNLLQGAGGILASIITGSSYLMVDGFFSIVNWGSVAMADVVAGKTESTPTRRYPLGKQGMESLFLMFRSLIMIVLFSMGIVSSLQNIVTYFTTGEATPITNPGVIFIYTILMTLAGLITMFVHIKNNKKINNESEILKMETKASLFDALLTFFGSASLLVVPLIPDGTLVTSATFDIRPIIDSVLIIFLSMLILKEPIQFFISEIKRASGERMDVDEEFKIRKLVKDRAEDPRLVEVELRDVYVLEQGKNHEIHTTFSFESKKSIEELDELRDLLQEIISEEFERSIIFITFSHEKINQVIQ